jgi:hypothetical protein
MLNFLKTVAKRSVKAPAPVKAAVSVKAPVQRDPRDRWRAVAVTVPSTACASALACKGKRYLCHDAPRLPLAGCDAKRCDCKYRHLADRRGGPRRSDEKGGAPARVATNRRNNRDRRAAD